MIEKVLSSIETEGDTNGSVFSDDTYKEGTPEPEDQEILRKWEQIREAAQKEQLRKEEEERMERVKLAKIRELQKRDPLEGERQMRGNNLRIQGFSEDQIKKANKPLHLKEIESNWDGFLPGTVLLPATTEERTNPHTNRRTNRRRSTQAEPTTNVKVLSSKRYKTEQRREYNQVRASRRLAGKPPEFGMFAPQLYEHSLHNPSTRKRSPASPHNEKKPTRSRALRTLRGL